MDLRSVSHSCISSWWRMTQIPVMCVSVDSPLTCILVPLFPACSYLSQSKSEKKKHLLQGCMCDKLTAHVYSECQSNLGTMTKKMGFVTNLRKCALAVTF